MKHLLTHNDRAQSFIHRILSAFIVIFSITQMRAQTGTWASLTNLAPDPNNGVMLLMTDGSVICHTSSGGTRGYGSIFDRLAPDSTGSYLNGTWTQITPMIRERYSFSSLILKDGRVYAAGGEYGTDGFQNGSHGEVYDPVTGTWTECVGPNQVMSDGDCKLLDNGSVIQAIIDQPFPTTTVIYPPSTNTYITGPSTIGGQNESMWLKLPDNSIVFVDEGALTSERYIPSLNQWIADGNVPDSLYDPFGYECGPGWMLPDGRAFFIGGTNHTAFYTPSGNNSPGTWAAGPDVPNNNGMPDAPGAMMVNGKILFACSPQPNVNVEFSSPTYFYEFDYSTNTYTLVASPASAVTSNAMCGQFDLLDLPDGTVLCGVGGDPTSAQYYIYTPAGTPLNAGKPVVADVTKLTCSTYQVTGTGFNGISEGSAFGDENESDSNYPLVRLTSGAHVYYARSYNWNSAGVQRGSAPDTAYFALPNGLPDGNYSLAVVANGIASDPISFIDSIPTLSSSLTPPAVCSGAAFVYTPASATNGATFTWTRAAVTGISNAAITTAQTSDPNEVLINTARVPVTVVYVYLVTGNGCSNAVKVSVVVNPPPAVAFTAVPKISCSVPDSVSFSNTTIAGGAYVWNFGDGETSSALSPLHVYLTSGSFNVSLATTSACGADSVTQANLIVISTPSAPTTVSPVNISCGGVATLTGTGSDTLQWYDQPAGGTLLGKGGTYVTPALNSGGTYYVETDVSSAPSFCTPFTDGFGTGANYQNSNFRANVFNVLQPCTLISVRVYSSIAGTRTVVLEDSVGNVLQNMDVNMPNGTGTITLNFPLSVGTGFQLGCGDNSTTTNLYRNATGAAFPYSDPGGYVTITGNNVPDNQHYYFFYDWQLQGPSCISPRTPVQVVITGGAGASFTYVENTNVVTFTNTSTNSTTWLWNFGDGNTSSSQNPVHTYTAGGTYTVTLTAFNSGCLDSTTETISISPLGINSVDLTSALSIFPNPTSGLITISAKFNSAEQIQVIITNALGQMIYETLPVITSNQTFDLNLLNEAKGIYFVQLKTNSGSVVRKLVLD